MEKSGKNNFFTKNFYLQFDKSVFLVRKETVDQLLLSKFQWKKIICVISTVAIKLLELFEL